MKVMKKLLLVPTLILVAGTAVAGNGTIGSFSRSAQTQSTKLPVKIGVKSLPVRQVESDGLARSGQIGASHELFYIKNSGFKNYSEYDVNINLAPGSFKSEKIRCDRENDFCNVHYYVSENKVIAWITKYDFDARKAYQANVQVGTINAAGDVTFIRPIVESKLEKPTRANALRGVITGFGPGMSNGSSGYLSVYIK